MINDTPEFQSIPTAEDSMASLSVKPPLVWPDARVLAGQAWYEQHPLAEVLRSADLISGVVVDAAEGALEWLEGELARTSPRKIRLVVVITPACPTREEHLQSMLRLVERCRALGKAELEIRLLALPGQVDGNSRYSMLPPTTLQAHQLGGETWMCMGSVGDLGTRPVFVGSLNLVFRAEPGLRDAWRKWFQFLFASAACLTEATCRVPYLVPPKGSVEAEDAWSEFVASCMVASDEAMPVVDPKTGEVVGDSDGKPAVPWDGGVTAMDPLATRISEVYAAGCLVSVNEMTRIKPLEIPVRAALLDQASTKTVGSLTQKQSFTLRVFDEGVCKEIDKCRKIADLVETLSFPLSLGNRWLPNAAKPLLERELEARNLRGLRALITALGGAPSEFSADEPGSGEQKVKADALVKAFISRRKEAILADLNEMYKDLKRGESVPEARAREVLQEVENRLTAALTTRLTPTCTYNPLGAPELSEKAPADNWSQPLALLVAAAKRFREHLTDSYFDRRFSNQAFTKAEFLRDCNVFGDPMAGSYDSRRAADELAQIREIIESETSSKEKCEALWELVAPRAGGD